MVGAWLATTHTFAQVRNITSPMTLPPMAYSAPDGAWAVDVNPAALGFLRAYSIDAAITEASKHVPLEGRGYGLSAATPLPFGLAAGISAETISPTLAARSHLGARSRGRASLALSWSPSEVLSFGSAVRFINAASSALDGIVTLDASMAARPNPYLSFTLLGRDLTNPRPEAGYPVVLRSGTLAIGVRPTGRDDVTAEASSSLTQGGDVGLAGGIYLRLPYVGRLMANAQVPRLGNRFRDFLISAGIAIDWGYVGASFSTHIPEGTRTFPGWTVGMHLGGYLQDGLPGPARVAEIRVESDSARSLLRVLTHLEEVRRNPEIAGVLIRMQTSFSISNAQEMRIAVDALKKSKKTVICHLETGHENALYACAGANALTMDPANTLELIGPHSASLMLGDLLKNVGIHADFVRIGDYKSAPEQYTRNALTEPAREQKELFIGDVFKQIASGIAQDRKKPYNEVTQWIDNGPYSAEQAVTRQILTHTADEDQLDDVLKETLGRRIARKKNLPTRASHHWGHAPRVGVLLVDGTLVEGESYDIPILGMHFTGAKTILDAIDDLDSDPSVRAIVVRIDSPGGSALASDQIWRALMRVRKKKPIVASFGAVAASGGYYIGAAADEIVSTPATLTGSIGIFFGKVDFAPLAEKIGIGIEHFKRGKRAGATSFWRPFSDDERSALENQIRLGYDRFLHSIVAGRGTKIGRKLRTVQDIDKVGQGHTWSGDRAQMLGLVDTLGSFNTALERAKSLAHLREDAEHIVLPEVPFNIVNFVLSSGSQSQESLPISNQIKQILSWASTVYTLSLDRGAPLALMPEIIAAP